MEAVAEYQKKPHAIEEEGDFLKLNAVDHVEFWVGNAKQAAIFWKNLGFKPVAYSGLETGNRRYASWIVEQNKIRFALNTPYNPHDPMAVHAMMHGDSVKTIALTVDNVEKAWKETTRRGGQGIEPPTTYQDANGIVRTAAIQCFGETLMRFVERNDFSGVFMPGYEPLPDDPTVKSTGLAAIDHIVGNVELGKMNYWANWFHEVLGFKQILHFDENDISTQYSALMSKVMSNDSGRIKFPINEPAEGKKKSQIEEYLNYNIGPGVQHIALITGDIISTTRELRKRGLEFLRVPKTYYDALPGRIGEIDENYADIAELGILADRDDEGYLLQIFTHPIQDRPTLFLEIIQRRGSQGFGQGNFQALFESIEIEQQRRGNL